MSDIESLISEYNNMCGESETEMGTLAQNELDDLRRFKEVGAEILRAYDRKYALALDEIINTKLRRILMP